jgi:hypothetical protein
MASRFASVLFTGVLCSTPVAALAQPDSPTTVSPVTVNAPPRPKAIEKQAHTFVQSYAAAQNPEIDQIGRWRNAVCVEVMGLPRADQAAAILARIESVAQAVGLPPTRKGCRANVEIVFSDQPQRVMDIVARRREVLLGYYHLTDRDRLKTVTHPIQSWYVTATKSDGEGGGEGTGEVVRALQGVGLGRYAQFQSEVIDDPDNVPPIGCASSPHFTACLESEFANVFMVADSKALQGKDLGGVADYMVMLVLSQPRSLDGCNALPSVIDLVAKSPCPGRDAPDGLTPADAAYLTALYAADPQAKKAGEQSDIAGRMAKILIKANAGGR